MSETVPSLLCVVLEPGCEVGCKSAKSSRAKSHLTLTLSGETNMATASKGHFEIYWLELEF